ncbi:hypothetical protein [Glutamicibacter nicotianae]|uniref:hypothetical protein n=1 Tax=Glutamicibacter nicotianae TaxID=37929 RepID=UPI00195E5184|nr:hypothetical protein [Glutamicibacter nicotianae]MBM7767322.1 hypothetical protein [Glutamicibacter nicotianae]
MSEDLKQERIEALKRLREPFEPGAIGKLPKPYRKDSQKGNCQECGGYHGLPAMHLDFVGHAALTDRLLQVDPEWHWEPLSFDQVGLPQFDGYGGLWIRLTVCGVTRLGYGDAQGKSGANAIKEAIGDALRNAGMRFGAALDLWHKGDLWEAKEARGEFASPDTPPANHPNPGGSAEPVPAPGESKQEIFDKQLAQARGNRGQLEALGKWARNSGAPESIINQIKAAIGELDQAA